MNMLFAMVIALCVFSTRAEEGKELTPSEKSECVIQLLEWCNGMQYPQDGRGGISMMSINYLNDDDHYRVFCATDTEGTNCTRNGSPWFTCSPDHVLTYKGEVMSESMAESMAGVDNGICETANKAANEFFGTNDNETLTRIQEGMESFYEGMARLQEQMFQLRNMMNNIPMMGGDIFGGVFPNFWPHQETVTLRPNNEQPSKKDSNEIEME